jgi:hypothetical protein
MLQRFDKVQFTTSKNDVRLGVVIENDEGSPEVYTIDKDTDPCFFYPSEINNVQVVGRAHIMALPTVLDRIQSLVHLMKPEDRSEFIDACPGVGYCRELPNGSWVFCETELPLTFEYVGQFTVGGVTREVNKGSDGKYYSVNPNIGEQVQITADDLFAYFAEAQQPLQRKDLTMILNNKIEWLEDTQTGKSASNERPRGKGKDGKTSQELIATKKDLIWFTLTILEEIDGQFSEGQVEIWEMIDAWKEEYKKELEKA